MRTIDVPIRDRKKPPALKFPARCVNCGEPKKTVLPLKLNMGVQYRGQTVLMDLPVPLCAACEKKERSITNVTLVPFAIFGLLTFVIVFIPVVLIAPEGTTSQTLSMPFVLGAAAGLVAGLIVGTLAEFVIKFLFVAVYGRLLLKRPLTIFSMLADSEDVPGLSARFGKDKSSLSLIFENDDVAQDFKRLNSL